MANLWNFLKQKDFRREILLFFVFPFLYFAIQIFRLTFPFCWLYLKIENFFIFCYYKFSKKGFLNAKKHLKLAFPLKSDAEIEKIAKLSFGAIIRGYMRTAAISHIRSKKKFFKLVEVEGLENLQRAHAKNRGVICLVPHLSSWELAAVTPAMLGFKTYAVSETIKSFLVQKMMVQFRARKGMINIKRRGSYAKLLEVLREGNCLVIMIDQDTKVRGTFVDFFGKQAYTPLGAARLALETGALVVPMAMTENPETGNYRFKIYPELPVIKTENLESDLQTNTQLQTSFIEKIVRDFPTQWTWMHRRWHHTPESIEFYYSWRFPKN